MMKRIFLLTLSAFFFFELISQKTTTVYQTGMSAEKNINALLKIAPYTDGAVGFDNRYQGIKGSPRLFDSLITSFLRVKSLDYYIQVAADLDIAGNSVIFNHPKTGKLTAVPAEIVTEIIFNMNGRELRYLTTAGYPFEKQMNEKRFVQVLTKSPVLFFRMPVKTFVEADYKGAYSADRRYDEFQTTTRYYLMGSDSMLHQIQLNRKALEKLYPDKKDLIQSAYRNKKSGDDEALFISVIEQF